MLIFSLTVRVRKAPDIQQLGSTSLHLSGMDGSSVDTARTRSQLREAGSLPQEQSALGPDLLFAQGSCCSWKPLVLEKDIFKAC